MDDSELKDLGKIGPDHPLFARLKAKYDRELAAWSAETGRPPNEGALVLARDKDGSLVVTVVRRP